MFWSRLAVRPDQLAHWESFSGSHELLSRHCSLAGCARGLGRHQTGSAQQVEAMDVYLAPFIKPQNQETGVAIRGERNKAVLTRSRVQPLLLCHCGYEWRGDWEGFRPPAGWLLSSFFTVLAEPGFESIPLVPSGATRTVSILSIR